MSDLLISLESLYKALEMQDSQSLKKRPRYEGEYSDLNIPKTIKGRLPRSRSADAFTSLHENETQMVIAFEKLRETTENRAKEFQKLREKVEGIARKLVDPRTSEAEGTRIQTKKEWTGESYQCTKKEWQVLTDNFKEIILIGNITYGNTGLKIEEKEVDALGYMIAKQLPSWNEAWSTELIMGCQKLDENQEESTDQIMRKLEDLNSIIEANKILKKKKYRFKADQCTMMDLEVLTDNFNKENLIGDTSYGELYRGKLKLDSTGAKTKDVVVKIWDDKVDCIDDGKVIKEEVKFLDIQWCRNLPKLMSFCNNG